MGKDLEIIYRTITIPEHKLHRWINLLGIDGKSTKKVVQKEMEEILNGKKTNQNLQSN